MTSIVQTATSAVKNEIAFNSCCREIAKGSLSLARNYVKSTFTGVLACPNPSRKITTPIGLKDRCINFIKAPLLLLRAPLLYLPLINRVTQLALRFLSPREAWNFVISCPFQCCSPTELKIRYNENAVSVFKARLLLMKNIRENNKFNPLTFADKNLLNAYIKLSPPLSIDLINSPEFKEDEVKARYSEDTRRKFIEGYFISKIRAKEQFTKSDLDLSEEEKTVFISKLGFTSQGCTDIFFNVLIQFPEKKLSVNLKKELNQYKKGKNSL